MVRLAYSSGTKISDEKRAVILKAAEKVFAHRGFGGARLAEISAEAGLPKANLLYYFRSKEDIYRSVCHDVLKNWLGALGDISADDKPDDALQKYIEAKLELSRLRPNASKVFAMEIISGAPVIGDYLERDLKKWVDNQVEVFNAWQERGEIRRVSPRHVLFLIWAATQTYADFEAQITAVLGTESIDFDEHAIAAETVTGVILRGLGTR